ncbi:NAD(P)-dependent oxidoreductase [Nakamurella deserti]|uniref:NAD(P)-dependent oxidoreductase n=1 Tax=Nakamurella deserti TaxID=2164074 RepID=UPI000DBE6942|nr:NAD(P)-dependent oxidoreductase [Nakamurella deserti]
MTDRHRAVYADLDGLSPRLGRELLEDNGFEVTVLDTADPAVIAGSAAARAADVLLVGWTAVDDALLAALPRLRMVSLASRGCDTVDLAAADRRGVWVAALGSVGAEEVATHAWALALALVRRLPFFAGLGGTPAAAWSQRPAVEPRRLSGLTLGVLGLGRIGRTLIDHARPAVAAVIAHDPRSDFGTPAGVRRASLDETLSAADVLVVALPLDETTTGLIGATALARLPAGAYLVNVARGPIVDTSALVAALDAGRLAGAAVDVLDVEPPLAGHPLLGRGDVLVTPHVGFLSADSSADYVLGQARNVLAWARDGRPLRPVNDPLILEGTR